MTLLARLASLPQDADCIWCGVCEHVHVSAGKGRQRQTLFTHKGVGGDACSLPATCGTVAECILALKTKENP